jgi:hypothetical protein
MFLNNFFVSDYLNRITQSRERATVLSFKGLALNLAYGGVGLLYALLLSLLRRGLMSDQTTLVAPDRDNLVFMQSMGAFPLYFTVCLSILVIFAKCKLRNSGENGMD